MVYASMKNEQLWEVYIIKTKSGKLYTGITKNLDKRFKAHQNGPTGARFFRISSPDAIIYREPQQNRSLASKRECEIKKMNRLQKLALCLS